MIRESCLVLGVDLLRPYQMLERDPSTKTKLLLPSWGVRCEAFDLGGL